MANIIKIETYTGHKEEMPQLLNGKTATGYVCLSAKNFENESTDLRITIQSNAETTVVDDLTDKGWQTIKWEDGTDLIFSKNDTAILPACGQRIRAIQSAGSLHIPPNVRFYLK
jgi:hypothetical protein